MVKPCHHGKDQWGNHLWCVKTIEDHAPTCEVHKGGWFNCPWGAKWQEQEKKEEEKSNAESL